MIAYVIKIYMYDNCLNIGYCAAVISLPPSLSLSPLYSPCAGVAGKRKRKRDLAGAVVNQEMCWSPGHEVPAEVQVILM